MRDARLAAPIAIGPGDEAELHGLSWFKDRLGRRRRCARHLVLHRAGPWTHLYRVTLEHGRPLVLLERALPGDARALLRAASRPAVPTPQATRLQATTPQAPRPQAPRPLAVRSPGCEAASEVPAPEAAAATHRPMPHRRVKDAA